MTESKSVLLFLFFLGISTLSHGTQTNYFYDALGRLQKVESLQSGDSEYIYDEAGNRTEVIVQLPPSNITINYTWSIVSHPILSDSIRFEWTSNGENCGGNISPGGTQGNIQLSGTSNSVQFQPNGSLQRATLTCLSPNEAAKTINSTFEDDCANC